jgi:HEAT repeat protein
MYRPLGKVLTTLGGILTAATLAGCGGKPKADDDHEPPAPVVAQNEPAPAAAPPAEPKKPDEPQTPAPPMPKDKVAGPAVPPPFALSVPPPPVIPQAPMPMPKDGLPDKPQPKEPAKDKGFDPNKPFEWPTALYNRPLSEYIKDIDDPDPAIREQGLRTVPLFGPVARTAATKAVIRHMNATIEPDPGVRAAAFEAIGAFALFSPDGNLETEADTNEALRLLTLTIEASGGATRLHAVNTLGSFGPRAAGSIPALIGQNMTTLERAYETRRAVASTLGAIGNIKDTGPSARALKCLTDVLINDQSAAVRLAAYQSIFALGPVYLPPAPPAPGMKPVMTIDQKTVDGYVKTIKARLQPFKPEPGSKYRDSPTGLMERNSQVEIFARLALMRLDVKEQSEENLNGIAKYVTQPGDSGPKLQALHALMLMGPVASRKINDVCKALEDEDPQVVVSAATTLVAMGTEGKPAIEFLEKMKSRGSNKEEKAQYEQLATRAIKAINEAKPIIPKP